ncbi:iron-sulfur cluster assembly scaffold protein [Maridesulfovibrio frigidus]|uniref:iron-sulfur cluster assembly scaffold protein n=1 Tax=Maridesulfovibrio frigidus TaxID=340956 RepID=UPI0004E203CC|nr:iron-sulfur cluster assembly scaffold protein [Maridesulfovibrio frigidus]
MSDPLDSLLLEIQQKCDDAAVDMFGEETTLRWKNPSFAATMEKPDTMGEVTGTCGDCIKIFLLFEGDKISEASFYTDGCGASIVSSDVACELAKGKSIDEASEIGGEEIIEVLGKIPEDKRHCAHLASSALQDALGAWLNKSSGA